MRLVYWIFFIVLFHLPSFSQDKKISTYCNAFTVTEIKTSDENSFNFNTSAGVLYVTVTNICKDCKIKDQDYILLTVLDTNNDTIGSEPINGVPKKYKSSLTYPVFINKNNKKEIKSQNIKVTLENYCDNLKLKNNLKITALKPGTSPYDLHSKVRVSSLRAVLSVLLILGRIF